MQAAFPFFPNQLSKHMSSKPFTIALDGPAAAGKGTIARALSKHFGMPHLDTGLLYRAVGYKVSQGMEALQAAKNLTETDFADPAPLRTRIAGEHASQVAAIPEIRAQLLEFQRNFSCRNGGAILDGRDIGTVICPNANAKLFVTADDRTRARRRFDELWPNDPTLTYDAVFADLQKRNARDASRSDAPMAQASDALLLDTTKSAIDAAVAKAVRFVQEKRT